MKKILALYDKDDNLVTIFEDYSECANYLGITLGSLKSQLSRIKHKKRSNHVISKTEHKIYKIYRIEV